MLSFFGRSLTNMSCCIIRPRPLGGVCQIIMSLLWRSKDMLAKIQEVCYMISLSVYLLDIDNPASPY